VTDCVTPAVQDLLAISGVCIENVLSSYRQQEAPLGVIYDGPWQLQAVLYTKFEVASFNRCRNIKGEAPNSGELP